MITRKARTRTRSPQRSKPSERRSAYAHSKVEKNRRWLVGYKCFMNAGNYGCECNIDVPKAIKNNFKRKYGMDYDDYCLYELVEAPTEKKAYEIAEEGTDDQFPEVEVVGLAK